MIRLFIFIFLLGNITSFGQEYPMDTNPSISSCGGFFTDSGGNNGDYASNENLLTTICADRTTGTHIRLTFSQIDLKFGDELCFFDGSGIDAPMLACASDYFNGFAFIVQATAANPTGCLTLTFNSNGSEVAKGWEANIDCIPSCQLVQAELLSTNPISAPLDTGWIDICQGERVSFTGKGNYPQNGLIYNHSDNGSTFEWDFGDGTVAFGTNVSHIYEAPGGYKTTLIITDQFGCTNGNFVAQRIRVATKPEFAIGNLPDEVCVGEPIQLSASLSSDDTLSTVEINTQEGAFLFNGVRSDSLALPDGNGTSYETSIRFTDFAPGQVLNDLNDLQSICLNMEHSWLHDMEISITCPNGKSVSLQQQEVINEEVYLGIPNDNDGVNPKAGIGFDYCWTPISTNGTITEFATQNDKSSPNEPYYLPTGDFNSFESLEKLLGCPLNGEWAITVTDLWEQDNGWIFSWGIDINPDLYPSLETFEPQITDFKWQDNPDITEYAVDKITARPKSAGQTNFILEVADNFGCSYDTAIQINVLPANHPNCLNCEETLLLTKETTICKGESIQLKNFIDPFALGAVSFQTFPDYEFSFSTHPTVNPFESSLQVSNVTDGKIALDASNLISVCINLESGFNADLSIVLVSPNGINLKLSIENGGSSDGYINTCFTANAATAIADGTGPFTGNFKSEEPFTNLAESDVNGVWQLRVSDDAGTSESDVNILKSWSMTFSAPSDATFNWSPADELSCTNCINPTATTTETRNYILEKNLDGCQIFDTLTVNVLQSDAPSSILNYSLPDGKVLLNWTAVPGADAYEVSVNGTGWVLANDNLFHTIEELTNGDNFTVRVRGLFTQNNCVTAPIELAAQYILCDLESELINTVLTTRCATIDDGEVLVNISGGIPPYNLSFNDSLVGLTNHFTQLAPGDYTILVEDASQKCGDTLTFTIDAPPPLNLTFDKKDLACFGDIDGSANVLASGGVGGYRIIGWSDNLGTASEVFNLKDGKYTVTIADGNNCEVIDTVEINQPDSLSVTPSQSPVICFGEMDGGASIKVLGGTPPYNYIWNNTQTGSSAINLGQGKYEVTVTDANSCQSIDQVTITQPEALVANLIIQPISCSSESDAVIQAEPSGGIPPYKYRWSNGQTNKLAFNLAPGTYFLTLSDSRGCQQILSQTIEAPNPLAVSIKFSPSICNGEASGIATVSVVGGTPPYSYLWNDTNNQTTPIAQNLVSGDYQVTVIDSLGCTQIGTVSIDDSQQINISSSSTPTSCPDKADGTAKIIISGSIGNYSYLWDNGDTTDILMGLSPGFYGYSIEDNNGCQFIDSVLVSSPKALVLDSIIQKSPLCNGLTNGELQAFVSGGVAPYNYNWDNGQTANPFIGVNAGTHTLRIIDANACLLQVPDIFVTEPNPLELVTISTDALCFNGNEGTAKVDVIGGVLPYSYLWNDINTQQDSTALNLTQGTYTVQVRDKNDCISRAEVVINQPETPISANITQTFVSCFSQNQSSATATAIGGTGTNYTYEWSSGATTNIVANLSANTHFVTISDENNCQAEATIDIQELDSIEIDLASVEPSCDNTADGRMAITNISGGAGMGLLPNYTINWNTNPSKNQEFITNLVGDKTYSVTVTDSAGCFNSMERVLGLPAPISITLATENISCFGAGDGSISLMDFNSNEEIIDYEWSVNIPDTTKSLATNLSVGDYSLSVLTKNGCSATAYASVQEPEAIFLPNSEIFPNICNNDLSGSINISVAGGSPAYTFQWSNGSTAQNLEGVTSGNYEVSITDANNCELTQSFELINPEALAGEVIATPISCFGDRNGRLAINSTGGQSPYLYSLDGVDFNGLATIVGLSAGNYSVFIKDKIGCIWKSEAIPINNPPEFKVIAATPNTIIELGDSTQISASFENNAGMVQFSWESSNSNSFTCIKMPCKNILVKPLSNTTYEIYAIDENGCEATDAVNLFISKSRKILVPSGFSPNFDGINDVLMVHGKENSLIKSFKIFDRWGTEVFSSTEIKINDPATGWDGTFKGETLNSGVFAWLLEVEYEDGEQEIFKGSTTLIR